MLAPPRNGADDFDIEHDFAVRPVRVAGRLISAVIHRNSRHGRGHHPETREVRLQILWPETTTELNDRHAFAPRRLLREVVQRGELSGTV